MKFATGKDDPALHQTSWPLPDVYDDHTDSIDHQLIYGTPNQSALLGAAAIVAAYRALIEDGTTAQQTKRLAALRRVYRRMK